MMPKRPTSHNPPLWSMPSAASAGQLARAMLKEQLNSVDSLYRQGKLHEALALAKTLAEKHPNAPFPPFMMGNILFAQGQFTEAITSLERALRLKPDFAEAHNNTANILNAGGKFEAAIDRCRKALKINPSFVEAHNNLGNALAAIGRHDEAIASYTRALELKPDYAHAHNGLGNVLAALERHDEAIASYTRALKFKSDSAQAHNGLGNVLNAAGRPDAAAASCETALRLKPDFVEAHNNLGNAYVSLNKFEQAVACYNKALHIRPGFAAAHSNLGIALNALGKHEEAIACCSRALEIAPSLADAHRIKGIAALALDNGAMAAREFEAALRLKPEFPDALVGLARAQENQSMLAEARTTTERAVAMAPRNAEARRLLAHILALQGHAEESRANFMAALEIDPASASAHLARGKMFLVEGKLQEAQAELERVLELDQNQKNLIVRSLIARVRKVREGDGNMLALIAEAENAASLPETWAVTLHFALGKCYDDISRYDLAFRHFEEGARIKRKRLKYSADNADQYVDSIRRFFAAANIERLAGHGFASKVPIFILGMPRSGTTLTESILASHPLVAPGGELLDLKEISNRPHGEASVGYPLCLEGIPPAALAEMGERYVKGLIARAPEASRITDKMPRNFFSVGLIHLMLPNAKIIHMRRDPVDTCLSNFMQLFDHGHHHSYDLAELGRYYRGYDTLMSHWRSVLPRGSFHEVDYENLVAEPEKEIRGLLDYCDLEWDEACLNFHETERQVSTSSAAQVRQPLYQSSVRKWQRYEKHLGPLIEALSDSGFEANGGVTSEVVARVS